MQGAAVVRLGVDIHAGDGQAAVAECIAHQGHRGAAVAGMAGVAVAEPVGRDRTFDAGPFGGGPHDAPGLTRVEMAVFLAAEDGVVGAMFLRIVGGFVCVFTGRLTADTRLGCLQGKLNGCCTCGWLKTTRLLAQNLWFSTITKVRIALRSSRHPFHRAHSVYTSC